MCLDCIGVTGFLQQSFHVISPTFWIFPILNSCVPLLTSPYGSTSQNGHYLFRLPKFLTLVPVSVSSFMSYIENALMYFFSSLCSSVCLNRRCSMWFPSWPRWWSLVPKVVCSRPPIPGPWRSWMSWLNSIKNQKWNCISNSRLRCFATSLK